jgi:hypothetical protein
MHEGAALSCMRAFGLGVVGRVDFVCYAMLNVDIGLDDTVPCMLSASNFLASISFHKIGLYESSMQLQSMLSITLLTRPRAPPKHLRTTC